jgi:hypothetical protein
MARASGPAHASEVRHPERRGNLTGYSLVIEAAPQLETLAS